MKDYEPLSIDDILRMIPPRAPRTVDEQLEHDLTLYRTCYYRVRADGTKERLDPMTIEGRHAHPSATAAHVRVKCK